MTGRTKLPNPRKRGEPVTIDWIRSNCRIDVTAVPMTECWTWLGGMAPDGYGRVRKSAHRGPLTATHRVTFELAYGAIPGGLHVDHVCRNRGCCNPAHLDLVTPHENTLRSAVAGIARLHDPRCRVCGGTRTQTRGPAHNRPGRVFNARCADCMARMKREWRARKRLEARCA